MRAPRANNQAVNKLPTIPIAATQIIGCASAGDGSNNRRTASAAIARIATSSNSALISAARIDAFLGRR